MSAKWYYQSEQGSIGPLSSSELRARAQAKQIDPDTKVRKGADGRWVSAKRVKGLFDPAEDPRPEAVPTASSLEEPEPPPGPLVQPSLKSPGQPPTASPPRTKFFAISLAVMGALVVTLFLAVAAVQSFVSDDEAGNTPVALANVTDVPQDVEIRVSEDAPDSAPPAEEDPSVVAGSSEAPQSSLPNEQDLDTSAAEAGKTEEGPGQSDLESEPRQEPGELTPSEPTADEPTADESAREPMPGGSRLIYANPFSEEGDSGVAEELLESMKDYSMGKGATADADGSGEPEDPRVEALEEVFSQQAELFMKWKPDNQKLQLLLQELKNGGAERDLKIRQLQETAILAGQIQADMRALKSQFGAQTQSPRLQQGLIACEKANIDLTGQVRALETGIGKNKVKIESLQHSMNPTIVESDRLSRLGFSLSDPFGRCEAASHQRVIELSQRWIATEPDLPMPHLACALAYAHTGKFDLAANALGRACELDPRLMTTAVAAGAYCLAKQGKVDEARAQFAELARNDPRGGVIYAFWGQMCIEEENYSSAGKQLHKAILNAQDCAAIYEQSAWLVAAHPNTSTSNNGKKAVEYATKACELTEEKCWSSLETLAAANAKAEDLDAAVKWAHQALDAAPPESQAAIQERLDVYQAQEPSQAQ